MVTVLACLPVRMKLFFLLGEAGGESEEVWHLSVVNGYSFTLDEVAAICLQDDLLAELQGGCKVSTKRKAKNCDVCSLQYSECNKIVWLLSNQQNEMHYDHAGEELSIVMYFCRSCQG